MEQLTTTVKNKEITFKTGFIYNDHFGNKVCLKSFEDSPSKKPLIAFNYKSMKLSYYHFSQLTPYTE